MCSFAKLSNELENIISECPEICQNPIYMALIRTTDKYSGHTEKE